MKQRLPSRKEWAWLRELARDIGLTVPVGKTKELVFDDMDIMTLHEIVAEHFICSGGEPTTVEKILAECEDDDINTLKDTKRKYIYELLEKLISLGFVGYIRAKDYNSTYEDKVKHHGSANLYYVTGKGFLAQQLLFLYPHITNKHFNFLKSRNHALFPDRQSFNNRFVIFEKQFEIDESLIKYEMKKLRNKSEVDSEIKARNPLSNVLNDASKLINGEWLKFKEILCPATYYLCEYSNLYIQRTNYNYLKKNEETSLGFSIKYISFLINFFESELKKQGFKNPGSNIDFLF